MMPPTGKSSDTTPRGLIIVIVILFIAIIAAGLYFYQSQEHQIKDSVTTDLSTIATLKANQITAWREDRLYDARGISSEAFFSEGANHFLIYGDNESRENILSRFYEMNTSPYYDNVILVDPQGNVRLSLDPAITSLQPSVKAQVNESLKSGDAVLTDFYQQPGSNVIHLNVISPLQIKANGSEKPVGAVLLSIDPDDFLYPLVQSWPVPSGSAETLLVEREGDHVLFLNKLRHQNNTALNLTIPLSQTDVPSVMAVLGTTGAFTGKDYRGVDVISVLEPIPGSPWFMVAKVDTEEAFSGWRSSSALIIALVAGSIIGALVIVGLLWQRRQKNYYHSLYVAEAERSRAEEALYASEARYRSLFEAAQDGILIVDAETGQIVDVNPFLIDMLGFSHEQFLTKKLWDLGLFSDIVANKEIFKKLQQQEYIRHEDLPLESADGRHIDVEFVSNVYKVDDKKVIQCNIRDITERKLAEVALRETNEYLNNLFDYANAPIITWDPGFHITRFNHAFEHLTGRSHEEVLGKTLDLLFPDETRQASMVLIQKTFKGERWESVEIPILTKEGSVRTVLWNSANVLDADGRMVSTIAQGVDITDRKRAEDALRQVNKQLNLLSSITRHDILNQLMALKGYLELSQEVIDKPETLIEFITKEEKAANTIEHQITFTKDYQELGIAVPEWQNVNASIKKAVAGLPMRDVHVEVDPNNPAIFADRLFEKVFYNLIDNALRYGGAAMKTIRVSSREIDTGLRIVCEDDGVGISAEDKKKLFTRGFGKNTGLGLFLSREILAITGITITENGIPGKGARFEITVPKGTYRFTGTGENKPEK
ncbi:MAG: PAS domain S-box protein [Methanoregula sp.]|nr:PAS domain S-box protein [Methanoregula sp.]